MAARRKTHSFDRGLPPVGRPGARPPARGSRSVIQNPSGRKVRARFPVAAGFVLSFLSERKAYSFAFAYAFTFPYAFTFA